MGTYPCSYFPLQFHALDAQVQLAGWHSYLYGVASLLIEKSLGDRRLDGNLALVDV